VALVSQHRRLVLSCVYIMLTTPVTGLLCCLLQTFGIKADMLGLLPGECLQPAAVVLHTDYWLFAVCSMHDVFVTS
jgi:hypothetical protein